MKRIWIIMLAMGLLAGATAAGADFYQVFNLQTMGTRSIAYAIDQTGWIAGCVKDSSDVHEAVVWERPEEGPATMHFLSTFGGAQSEARAIYYNYHTEKHRAVGWADDSQAHQRPFYWESGMSTIQALPTQNNPGQALGAYLDQVVGFTYFPPNVNKVPCWWPFVSDPAIPLFYPLDGQVNALNYYGNIVGRADNQAFLYNRAGFGTPTMLNPQGYAQ